MKTVLTLIAVLAVAAGTAFAGCGKKTTNTGDLEKYDADSKSITVVEDGEKAKITLTASTKVTNKDGDEVKIEDLKGKKVKVVSEHKKADSVAEV